MCSSFITDYFDPDDPNLDPEKANYIERVLGTRRLWPEDAKELIVLTNDTPTLRAGWPVLFRQIARKGEPTWFEAE